MKNRFDVSLPNAYGAPMKYIVYQDYVHNSGALFAALVDYASAGNVQYIDARQIIDTGIPADATVFFMPGGASRYVAEKLNGAGNVAIKNYVAAGGVYFGICAGAYYGCARTEWRAGTDGAICVDNELNFYNGTAHGPVAGFGDHADDVPAAITTLVDDTRHRQALYWGGPIFAEATHENTDVLARYDDLPDKPPAVIMGSFGQGRYVLSSPHLEIDETALVLMQFNVPANCFAELCALDGFGLSRATFYSVLDRLAS